MNFHYERSGGYRLPEERKSAHRTNATNRRIRRYGQCACKHRATIIGWSVPPPTNTLAVQFPPSHDDRFDSTVECYSHVWRPSFFSHAHRMCALPVPCDVRRACESATNGSAIHSRTAVMRLLRVHRYQRAQQYFIACTICRSHTQSAEPRRNESKNGMALIVMYGLVFVCAAMSIPPVSNSNTWILVPDGRDSRRYEIWMMERVGGWESRGENRTASKWNRVKLRKNIHTRKVETKVSQLDLMHWNNANRHFQRIQNSLHSERIPGPWKLRNQCRLSTQRISRRKISWKWVQSINAD